MHNKLTREQYGEAYANCSHQTVAVLCGRGLNRDFAEEISQGAWARGWERLAQLKDARRVADWITTIALNLLRDELSRSRRMTELPSDAVDLRFSLAMTIAEIDLQNGLRKILPRQRALLETVYLEDRNAKEVAGDLGTSVSSLHQRLSRARRSLRQAYGRGLADARQGGPNSAPLSIERRHKRLYGTY